jgi:pimeloyl-ACP methyl ester carboxylesterase
MDSYIRPVLTDPEIRRDGRAAIGSVDASHSRAAADVLIDRRTPSVLLLWASEDRVFPLRHAQGYAGRLNAPLCTVADSYTYTAEDQPLAMAQLLRRHLPLPQASGSDT